MADDRVFDYREEINAADELAAVIDKQIPDNVFVSISAVLPFVAKAKRHAVNFVAAAMVAGTIRGLRRERVRRLEQEAERAAWQEEVKERQRRQREHERWLQGLSKEARRTERERERDERFRANLKHGSMNKVNGGAYWDCECDVCVPVRQSEMEFERRRLEQIRNEVESFARELRIEWTQELLDSGFALPDGTVVLWGDATVSHHRARAEMLYGNVMANAKAAARHESAIGAIESAGVLTLRDLTGSGAAGSAIAA